MRGYRHSKRNEQMLSKIRIVLVATSHPGNIGATARAMKTMGLSELVLVAPQAEFPCAEATARAVSAHDILVKAQVVASLREALKDCICVIGTSARHRDLPWPQLNIRELGSQVMQQAHRGQVAIVFGRESTGLRNEELHLCHYHTMIPTVADFSSLNLAAAVQVLVYEIYMASLTSEQQPETVISEPLAGMDQVVKFYDHLAETLLQIDFLKPPQSKQMMARLQRLFNRIRMTENEMNILRGILTAIQRAAHSPGKTP